MPQISINGVSLYYEEHGTGAEAVVFAHGLLWSGEMFAAQVNALKETYRCITFDFRGQGQSEVTASGYDMDTLAEDAAALIEVLGCAPCHFVGLSMGGFIGQRLALRRPALLKSLTLLETTADPEPEKNKGRYRMLNFVARWFGLGLVAGRVMAIMFGQKFLNDPSREEARQVWRNRLIANNRLGITRATQAVIDREGVYDQLDQITLPTLIMVGDQDVATVPAQSERMQARIRGAKLVMIAGAGHTSTVEEPEQVNESLKTFLSSLPGA